MSHELAEIKPLYLSEEEALSLLELCLTGQSEMTPNTEQAILKLSNLSRRFLRSKAAATEGHTPHREAVAIRIPFAVAA